MCRPRIRVMVGVLTVGSFVIETSAALSQEGARSIQLRMGGTATFSIAGRIPQDIWYFGGWTRKNYGLFVDPEKKSDQQKESSAADRIVFPLCFQAKDKQDTRVLKFFTGVPCYVPSLESDKLNLGFKLKVEVCSRGELQPGKKYAVPEGEMLVEPGDMIAFSRSSGALGPKTIRIGAVPGKRGLVIGGRERSEGECYHFNTPQKLKPYVPNLCVGNSSAIPFECDFDNVPKRPVPTAIGITWAFKEKGDKIVVGDHAYVAEKDGATIEFTENGPVLSNVTRTKIDPISTKTGKAQEGTRPVEVVSTKASLMIGRRVLATVSEGDILYVTKEQGDWLWVDSIQGASETTRGWIHRRHVR